MTSAQGLDGDRGGSGALRAVAVAALVAVAATLAVVVAPLPAAADTQVATNSSSHAIPAGGLAAPDHSASSVYPAPITISGMAGTVTNVAVRLNGLTHANVRDVEVLLVGPGGQKMIVASDIGGNEAVTNISPTFDDNAATAAPDSGLGSGTYRPTNLANGFTGDIWPAPAPAPPYAATFAAFDGTNPNGTWNLYLADDASGDLGTLSGGWTLSVETGVATFPGVFQFRDVEFRGTEGGGVATVTIDRVSGADGAVGVVFSTGTGTATPGVDYTGISQFVAFADGQTTRTVDIPIADDPHVEGIDELVPITLSGPTGGATLGDPISGQVRIQDNDARANAFPITVPGSGTAGPASPYPSNIVVSGAVGVVTDVDLTLTDVDAGSLRDLDVVLVAPNGASTWVMGDVGTGAPVSNLNLTFDDEAVGGISRTAATTTGSYQPSRYDDGIPDLFPGPAPDSDGPDAVALAALDGTSANGTWSLYVVDGITTEVGSIGGGWSLSLTTTTASAGGPYTLPEGSSVTLSGATTPALGGATYEWDVDGDGQFDDATGQNPTVSASTLASIGLGDGPDSSNVRARVTAGAAVITSTATTLTVTNVAPTATLANSGPVALGSTADVTFTGPADPSASDTAAGFRYAYDLDDDGDWEVGDGTYTGSSTAASTTVPTSVLTAAGTYDVTGRILDKDGGFTDVTTTITVDPPANSPPVADAGPDQTAAFPATVTLDGTGSTDPDGDALAYSWVQTAGPAVILLGSTTATPSFTVPGGPATLTFQLTVTDPSGASGSDSVNVVVNGRPVADAGPDQTVNGGDTVTLDGTGSTDPDGDTLTYSWAQVAGPPVTVTGADTATPTFTAPTGPTAVTLALTVDDGQGGTDGDSVIITVNGPPTADAGVDGVVQEGATVTLDGTGSTDPDGNPLTYSWEQTDGPAVVLSDPNAAAPFFIAPAAGSSLVFALTVDDGRGGTDTDTVTYDVNRPPTADAGPDQLVNEGDTVTLDGSGSTDPEADDIQFSWQQTGGTPVTLDGAGSSARPTFTAPPGPASLTFTLTAFDGYRTDTDEVTVTVNGPPTADAGPDQTVSEGDTVALDGTGSTDPDGDTLGHAWEQVSGPSVALTGADTATPTFTAPEGPATLEVELTVDDGEGRTDTDTVTITVNGPPTADAGDDFVAVERTTATLDGTGSTDPDGDTLGYAWSQVAGPEAELTGSTTAQPTFTVPDAPAELTFRLTVDDGAGGTATDEVTITSQPRFTPDEAFVDHTYQVLLGRPADLSGLEYWTDRLGSGTTRAAVAKLIGLSYEATRGRVLDQRYQDWLSRRPDTAARDYWTSRLRAGTSVRTLEVAILASGEVYARAGGTDAAYVAELYDLLLGRAPSAADSAFWAGRVASKGRSEVAGSILTSPEVERRRVARAYVSMLGRTGEPSGVAFWAGQLDLTDDLRRVEIALAAAWVNRPGSST